MAKQVTTFRIDPELLAWVDSHAATHGLDRSRLLNDLLLALREGRLRVLPRIGVSPFPVHEVEPGSVPECPILVWFPQE